MKTYDEYQLVLHDFGNFRYQILKISIDNKAELDALADNMNYLFSQSGVSKQFKAEVYTEIKPEATE
jgi:hypothetical protein